MTLPRNSVGSAQLRSNAVGAKEIRRGAVRSGEIRNRSIRLSDLATKTRTSLLVRTFNAAGDPAEARFHLIVAR